MAETEKKTYADNGKGYSSLGNLSGRLKTLEFKTTQSGKTWASFSVSSGKTNSVVRGKTFSKKLIPILESFVEGDDISMFGKLASNFGKDGDRAYTSFVAFSVDDEMAPSGVTAAGEVVCVVSSDFADYVDIDVTQDDAYPEFVRLRLCDAVDAGNFKEGEKVRVQTVPQGKFGEFTITKLLPFVRKSKESSSPASDRFKRPAAETPAPAMSASAEDLGF